ncbi:pyroglutamyl-peptidase I [Ruania rhizosphaerae]|uniref:pyroglutamyl-peptidase I family protein n=1 Tax=Ruania rhizosphaerae TaxID=1840413 RepID=UPI001F37D69B|nr:pyroglutamyl-peptidase I [Ruania rhizosphaerae]
MPERPPTVLLTGFEPFDGASSNPSIDAVRLLATAWDREEELVVAELPVAYGRAVDQLEELLRAHRPTVAVGVGLAGGRRRVSLERLAVNLRDARIPDNDGAQPVDEPVLANGPAARWMSLPAKRIASALAEASIPAELSMTAGTYVCNTVAYHLATWAASVQPAGTDRVRPCTGFVHVPPADVLGVPALAGGLRLVLDVALAGEPELAIPAGSTS